MHRSNRDRIAIDCDKIFSNKNCKYFIENLEHNRGEILKDIAYIKSNKKIAKRWVFIIPVGIGIGIMALIALIASERASTKLQKVKAMTNLDILEDNLNTTANLILSTKNSFGKIISEMKDVRNEIDSINAKLSLIEEFNDILHIISLSLISHYNNANKFSHFYSGNLKSHFFSIIDISEFNTKIDVLRYKLDNNLLLPPLNSYDLVRSSQIFSFHNVSHISISLYVPLLNKEKLALFEFVPIPFRVTMKHLFGTLNHISFSRSITHRS